MSCDLKTNGFATLRSYILDQNGQQLYEMDGSGNWQHTNVFVGGQVLATYDAAAVHYYLGDWLGTKRGQASVTISGTTATATAEQTCWSLPFGDDLICSGSGTDATEHHFTGRQRDTESGLDSMHARYYSSATGRFLSADPSGLSYADPTNPQSLNLYSYSLNDPLIVIDPSGLDPCAPNLPASGSVTDVTDQSTPLVITQGADASGNAIGTQTVCVTATVGPDPIPDVVVASANAIAPSQPNYPTSTTGVAPNNGEPPSTCLAANIAAVNAVSNLNVSKNNVVGQPFIYNGGLDVNFSVPGASPSQLPAGRYPSSFLNRIFGIGSSLHVPGPGGADPSTYGMNNGNFTFTTHIDSAYPTWHTPLGALIHFLADVRDHGAHRGPC